MRMAVVLLGRPSEPNNVNIDGRRWRINEVGQYHQPKCWFKDKRQLKDSIGNSVLYMAEAVTGD